MKELKKKNLSGNVIAYLNINSQKKLKAMLIFLLFLKQRLMIHFLSGNSQYKLLLPFTS